MAFTGGQYYVNWVTPSQLASMNQGVQPTPPRVLPVAAQQAQMHAVMQAQQQRTRVHINPQVLTPASYSTSDGNSADGLPARLKSVLTDLSRTEKKVKSLEADCAQLRQRNSGLENEKRALASSNGEIKKLLGTLESAVTDLQTKNISLQQTADTAKTVAETNVFEINNLQQQKDFLNTRNATLSGKCEKLYKELSEIRDARNEKLDVANTRIGELETEVADKDTKLAELEKKLEEITKTTVQTFQEKDDQIRQLTGESQVNELLNKDITSMEQESDNLWRYYRAQTMSLTLACSRLVTRVNELEKTSSKPGQTSASNVDSDSNSLDTATICPSASCSYLTNGSDVKPPVRGRMIEEDWTPADSSQQSSLNDSTGSTEIEVIDSWSAADSSTDEAPSKGPLTSTAPSLSIEPKKTRSSKRVANMERTEDTIVPVVTKRPRKNASPAKK